MLKSNLRTEMVIEDGEGCRYTLAGRIAIGDEGFLELSSYTEDLRNKFNSIFDIMKVYKVKEESIHKIAPENHDELTEDEIIWERKPLETGSLYELVKRGYEVFRYKDWVEGTEEDMKGILKYVYEVYADNTDEGILTVGELEDLASDEWIGVR